MLGFHEGAGFAATGTDRPAVLMEGLAAMAREAVDPPVAFEVGQVPFEGSTLVVARVDELPSTPKPYRVTACSKTRLKAHDGDDGLSLLKVPDFSRREG